MIISSFQFNFEEVIESRLGFKFNVLSMEKLTSTFKRKTRYSASLDDSSRSTNDKRQRDSSYSEDAILEAFNMAEGLATEVDFFLSKLSKPDKFDDRKVCLHLTTVVSSIEESVSKLERPKDVSVSDSKFKNTDQLVSQLRESLSF